MSDDASVKPKTERITVHVTGWETIRDMLERPDIQQRIEHDMHEAIEQSVSRMMGSNHQPRAFVFKPKGDVIDGQFVPDKPKLLEAGE